MPPPRSPSAAERSDLRDLLRSGGLRATPQRLAVLTSMRSAGGHHLSAEDIWGRIRHGHTAMNRSTVYRVLDKLAEAQLLKPLRLGDGVARFEIQDVDHHHAVCLHCGTTEDVGVDAVRTLGTQLRRGSGFKLSDQPLLFPGLCRDCAPG